MPGKANLKISMPKESVIFIVICLLGLGALLGAGILPAKANLARMDQDIAKMTTVLSIHQKLAPIETELAQQIKKIDDGMPPQVTPAKIKQENIHDAETALRQAAAASSLTVSGLDIDLASLAKNSTNMDVSMNVRGPFEGLRDFLSALARLPYLAGVDEIRIGAEGTARVMQIKLKLALS